LSLTGEKDISNILSNRKEKTFWKRFALRRTLQRREKLRIRKRRVRRIAYSTFSSMISQDLYLLSPPARTISFIGQIDMAPS
jgi:hypothetical protein